MNWLALVTLFVGPDGEREFVPPAESRVGEGVAIATRPRRRVFGQGDAFSVSADEFAHICWTMFIFASELANAAEKVGRAQGIRFTTPPSS